jgi:hypothetical protein
MPSLEEMAHEELLRKRLSQPGGMDDPLLAPFEHMAFAREWTRENPWVAVPSLSAAIPLYQLAKLLGVAPDASGTATKPSLDQLFAGYRGIGQGLRR